MSKLLLATLLIGMISGCTEPTVKSTKTNYTVPTVELQMVKLYEKAKEMQKELMKGMYVEGSFAKMRYYDGLEYIDAEQYYNETYGGGEQ
jgi:hypothetical protein